MEPVPARRENPISPAAHLGRPGRVMRRPPGRSARSASVLTSVFPRQPPGLTRPLAPPPIPCAPPRALPALCLMPGRPPSSAARPPRSLGPRESAAAFPYSAASPRRPLETRRPCSFRLCVFWFGAACFGATCSGIWCVARAFARWQLPASRCGRASETRVSRISGPSPGRALDLGRLRRFPARRARLSDRPPSPRSAPKEFR